MAKYASNIKHENVETYGNNISRKYHTHVYTYANAVLRVIITAYELTMMI